MASLLAFLQSEFTIISQESRRKCPDVKAAADEILTQLKTLKDATSGNLAITLAEKVNIIGALDLASSSSQSARLMSHIISLLHRLVSHAALPPTALHNALSILERTVGQADEVQLRALQCVMPLLTHYNCRGEDLLKAYEICFRLQASKSPTVINAAVAIIRQLVIWLFERVVEEDNAPPKEEQETLVAVTVYNGEKATLKPIAADAYIIMQDICLLTVDDASLKISLKTLNKCFGLELIESVLLYNSRVMHRHQVFANLIREKICPMVLKRLTEKSDFSQTCRLWKVVSALIREFHDVFATETEIFISCAVRLIDESTIPWERALVLETFRELIKDPSVLAHMEVACEAGQEKSKLLTDLFIAINNLILGSCAKPQETEAIYSQVAMKVSISQQLEKVNPPAVNDSYLVLVASECISGFLSGFLASIKPYCLDSSGKNLVHVTTPPEEDKAAMLVLCKRLLEVLWAAILKSHSAMLFNLRLDGEWQARIISSLMDLVKLESVLPLKEAQNATLSELTEIALPEYRLSASQNSSKNPSIAPSPNMSHGSLLVSDLNLSMSTKILTVGLEISELLDESWLYILHIVHGTDQFNVIKARRTSEVLGKTLEMDKMGEIADLCRRITESSRTMSGNAFINFLKALCTLASQITGNVTALFPAQKLKQVALLNVERFVKTDQVAFQSWELLSSQLEQVLSSPDVTLRGLGCETISLFTTQFAASVPGDKFNSILQLRVLGALERFYGIVTWTEVHKAILESLLKLLQHLGPHISDGWPAIFTILTKATCSNDASLPIIRGAFSSAKLICAEFLNTLPRSSIGDIVAVLSHFARITEDLNISLTAIGLLWDVADHVRRNGDCEDLWLLILKQLVALASDPRPEVRNSSIQSMMRAIEIGAVNLKVEEWQRILDDNLNPLMELPRGRKDNFNTSTITTTPTNATTLPTQMDLTHHSRDTIEKQWNETFLLIIQGLTQLFSKFLPTLTQFDEFEEKHWCNLLKIFSDFCVESKSSELTLTSVGCLSKLISNSDTIANSKSLWLCVWKCWCEIGGAMQPLNNNSCFNQESLIKFVKILQPLTSALETQQNTEWLNTSFGVLDSALQCPTPEDHIKDLDAPTELQRTVLEILDTLLDYEDAHKHARPLYLRRLSGWTSWLNELSDVAMTRSISVRRSRINTGSSLMRGGSGGKVTFIALVTVSLERLRQRAPSWANDPNVHQDGAYAIVIKSIGRLVTLKYRAPSGTGPISLWKIATKTLDSILLSILPAAPETSEGGLWPVVVELMESYLEVSRTQVPSELAIDQLDADEEFDIEQVFFIRDSLLPLMGKVQTRLIHRLLTAFERTSQLYTNSACEDSRGQVSPSTLVTTSIQPVIKEKLAITCLQSLFTICTDRSIDPSLPSHSRASFTSPTPLSPLPPAILHSALPIILARCQSVIRNYTHDKTLLGRMPFPRVRQDEMIYVLSSLNDLRLPAGLAEESTGLRRTLLGTQRGHLFYLYEEFCACLKLDDPPVVGLIQKSFCLLGLELGLIKS